MTPMPDINEPTESLRQRIIDLSVPEPNTGCWLWIGAYASKRQDYGYICHLGKSYRAHRASYEVFLGPIPAGLLIRHLCNNSACVNPDHLAVGTSRDNARDCVKAKRHSFGTRNGMARLNPAKVREIFLSTGSEHGLARRYGVGQTTIAHIKHRRTWRAVTNDL